MRAGDLILEADGFDVPRAATRRAGCWIVGAVARLRALGALRAGAEVAESVEPVVSAEAGAARPAATAVPMPRATASAPTRPTDTRGCARPEGDVVIPFSQALPGAGCPQFVGGPGQKWQHEPGELLRALDLRHMADPGQ